ncbi:GntR family transcriptional regulator [Gordonia sp. ABSL1-1]|uniref:GntR family transcriptional regulator n=1 Tax=Gordonia sp. ABSL1-1 TaxID=3053923 RepID=UPI00257253D1|nr:GntR family transcriptional regulator [Gordonia sp. ABSL1-1]MDL9938651.1 GntR family transcriptional regulator [Gordonia sp. ABSL1-1]
MSEADLPTRADESSGPAVSSTVAASPLADQVFETLRGWIVSGQLAPGYRLRVRDIADLVGTSVMPVREAIRRLVESGLAIHEPYKGARVRGLDTAELEHAYDVRILLEGEAARLGALAAAPAVADRMQEHYAIIESATASGDVTGSLHHDEALLDELYRAAGNEIIRDIIHGLWDRCRPYKALWAGGPDRLGHVEIWSYQPELIAAVRVNDADTAERVVRASYENAKTAIRKILTVDGAAPAHLSR